jgi:hypothetical protein
MADPALRKTAPRWASAIEGLAGTAKTTLVGVIREYVEEEGWTVRGFGTTTGSAKALQDAGVNAQTIAKLLASALPAKTARELWVVDESSLLATVPTNELLKRAIARGVERLVFVGDQKQHLAIEAGSPVRQLLADNLAVAQGGPAGGGMGQRPNGRRNRREIELLRAFLSLPCRLLRRRRRTLICGSGGCWSKQTIAKAARPLLPG